MTPQEGSLCSLWLSIRMDR